MTSPLPITGLMQQKREGTALTAELARERLLDIEARLRRFRIPVFGVLGASILASGPWLGWIWIVPLVPAIGIPALCQRLMVRSAHPERWAAAGWTFAPLMIAASVACTGGPRSPAVSWFAAAAVTLGARFERRGVTAGLIVIIAMLLASTIPVDPQAAAHNPESLIFAIGLTLAVTLFSAAVVQSDRDHRLEAVIDPLTGLLNRAALEHRFVELGEQARVAPGGARVGFLVVDVDRFKLVNDEHGHGVGDCVLEKLANAMRTELRAFDLVYRLGGEEFVVLLPGADSDAASEIAERLRAACQSSRPEGLAVTVSVGVAVAEGAELDFDRLYERADAALYLAKNSGRNCVRAFADDHAEMLAA